MDSTKYVRPNIVRMAGYTPGKQPRERTFVKLNTNETPYAPSPKVGEALSDFDVTALRLYPDPLAREFREEIATQQGLDKNWVICGNGSDDLLTIAVRTFVNQGAGIAYPKPSYSLYPVLGEIQGATLTEIHLDEEFNLPANAAEQAGETALFFIARPNAPTGKACPLDAVRKIAKGYDGILFIDEAYADFAEDDCIKLVKEFDNIVVSRSLSKSYSLAGIRFGYALAQPALITEMLKVKDSYNVNALSQTLALAAVKDQVTFRKNRSRICKTRSRLHASLDELGFDTLPSQTNFIFTKPPIDAPYYVRQLRKAGILIRYFPGPRTGKYVRITIGTDEDMDLLIDATRTILQKSNATSQIHG